ncbi:MAG: ABC transporter permease, partial [Myxococcota bacterium]|nr:ABC transporter permease [Myxococcota bacterium]
MNRIRAIAANTCREAIRDRILYSILLFAAVILLVSLTLEEITVGDQNKVVRSVAQGAIDAFGSIIAMFLGVSLVWKELERRTIYTILSKPIHRWMFIVGKYLGLLYTLAIEIAILALVYTLLMNIQQHQPPLEFYVSLGLLMVELMLLTAWATLFSTTSNPTTASGFTLAIFVIGHLADDIWLYGSQVENPLMRQVAKGLYWVLPNFEVFNIRETAVHETGVPWERLLPATSYGVAYTIAVLALAVWFFQR